MQCHGKYRGAQLTLLCLLSAASFAELLFSSGAIAQVRHKFPGTLPNATIVSDETHPARPPESAIDQDVAPTAVPSPAPPHSAARHHATVTEPTHSAAVEPTHAMLKVKNDTWAYAGPQTASGTIEHVHAGKLLNVTGSTHHYLQVKLKNGSTGYVPLSAVELTRPEDRIMRLSTDAAVLSQPNRYGKKLSEVHQGHDIRVIGVSMNYVMIRMKSGLEGYVPMAAAK
ncbi:MAG: hypothetical protein JO166_07720 [Deltaproteobacteria bacterium]|nr:hypothetical protein [Deltaproteobacteria bacterium]